MTGILFLVRFNKFDWTIGKQLCILFDVFIPSSSPIIHSPPLFYFASIGAVVIPTESASDEFLLSPSE